MIWLCLFLFDFIVLMIIHILKMFIETSIISSQILSKSKTNILINQNASDSGS